MIVTVFGIAVGLLISVISSAKDVQLPKQLPQSYADFNDAIKRNWRPLLLSVLAIAGAGIAFFSTRRERDDADAKQRDLTREAVDLHANIADLGRKNDVLIAASLRGLSVRPRVILRFVFWRPFDAEESLIGAFLPSVRSGHEVGRQIGFIGRAFRERLFPLDPDSKGRKYLPLRGYMQLAVGSDWKALGITNEGFILDQALALTSDLDTVGVVAHLFSSKPVRPPDVTMSMRLEVPHDALRLFAAVSARVTQSGPILRMQVPNPRPRSGSAEAPAHYWQREIHGVRLIYCLSDDGIFVVDVPLVQRGADNDSTVAYWFAAAQPRLEARPDPSSDCALVLK